MAARSQVEARAMPSPVCGIQGDRLRMLEGHKGTVYSIAFSPDGSTLASGSAGDAVTRLRLWDLDTGDHLRTL